MDNYTINECEQFENVIIDDIRYENELLKLKENNWITIKLIIDEKLQLKRLKNTYPEDWKFKKYIIIQIGNLLVNHLLLFRFHTTL